MNDVVTKQASLTPGLSLRAVGALLLFPLTARAGEALKLPPPTSEERIVVGTVAESEADILDSLFADQPTFDAADAEWL